MKLNTPKEITDRKQAEISKDIARTKEVKDELAKVTKELEESEAKFKYALANQRIRWSQEEERFLNERASLAGEIKELNEAKQEALIPIVEREEKSYALFTQAELAYKEADAKRNEADEALKRQEELNVLFEDKIDSLTDRETDVQEREIKVSLREKSVVEERENIKKLSSELSIKLTNFN